MTRSVTRAQHESLRMHLRDRVPVQIPELLHPAHDPQQIRLPQALPSGQHEAHP